MKYFRKVISASLSPNTQIDDVIVALISLCTPWQWKRGPSTRRIEDWFEKRYKRYSAFSFNSGRSALYALLKAFDIHAGDEVMVQAFTCVAVPNSVLWVGAKPVYVDVDSSLNMDVLDAEKKLTKKTRAIIVQHTLGMPAQMEKILQFAEKNDLFVIEDCAHSLGATVGENNVGSFGDAAFFSFGRDKVLSSVFGGVAIIQRQHKEAVMKLKDVCRRLPYPSLFWILQQLLHPLCFSIILPLYSLGIGKLILVFCQKLKLLSFPVYPEEKRGQRPMDFPAKYPNALASLLVHQLKKLDRYNETRKNRANYYQQNVKNSVEKKSIIYPQGSIFLRFPILVDNPSAVLKKAKQEGILLGNWYHNVIDPIGVDFRSVYYHQGSCLNAEYYANHIINLPTRISSKEAMLVVGVCKEISNEQIHSTY